MNGCSIVKSSNRLTRKNLQGLANLEGLVYAPSKADGTIFGVFEIMATRLPYERLACIAVKTVKRLANALRFGAQLYPLPITHYPLPL